MIDVIALYLALFIIVALFQCLVLELIRYIKLMLAKYKVRIIFHILISLLILFVDFYLICLMFAGVFYYHKVFDNFHDSLVFAVSSFSTLGSNKTLPRPWALLSPIVAIIGIVCIAFVTSGTYGIISSPTGSIFGVIKQPDT